jgi:PIN domain nuclease of toxin-antitoxin system
MMERYVMDAFAWVAYFEGENEELAKLVEGSELHTSIFNATEVASKAERSGFDSKEALSAIGQLSQVHGATIESAARIGRLHARMGRTIKDFGLGDCFVLELAERLEAKILTGDPHFKGLDNVVFLE